ncbi:hypothetical protein JKP88DRAFT_248856 [Tribonema minus]|uniref:Uncharacterized protein n=1 Tax=Tribonema minus TaxID=303371 RepID=A0A835YNX9_9STRA|nr:hypothetical protein JKP88DRAFT_248856 [Tribonema minus]
MDCDGLRISARRLPGADLENVEVTDDNEALLLDSRCIALDCEMVWANKQPAETTLRPVVVSIGVVDTELENLLYARIAVPPDVDIVDDSFARTSANLHPDWTKGIPHTTAQVLFRTMVQRAGTVVGWQLDGDLEVLGFEVAAAALRAGRRLSVDFGGGVSVRVVDLSDHFRSLHNSKCQLSEAYRAVFEDRPAQHWGAHHAAADARLCMELFRRWRRGGCPRSVPLNLKFYVVNVHGLRRGGAHQERHQTLFEYLRPERGNRGVVLEQDDGRNFKLKFREENERAAYMCIVRRRMQAAHEDLGPSLPAQESGSEKVTAAVRYSCRLFTAHLYEITR